jgi:intracellular septation protein A
MMCDTDRKLVSPALAPESAPASEAAPAAPRGSGPKSALLPVLLDVGVPLGSYYLLHNAFGVSVVAALAWSSVVPAARTIYGVVRERELNALAALMLVVNVVGIGVSLATGDPRMMIAKESGVSSVIALAILVSVALRRPLMSAGLKPYMTKGSTQKIAAWDRLSAGSPRFRRMEGLFSAIWGVALLADCVARLIGAFILPVSTMVWLSTVFAMSAIGLAIMVGSVAAVPIDKMIREESQRPQAA